LFPNRRPEVCNPQYTRVYFVQILRCAKLKDIKDEIIRSSGLTPCCFRPYLRLPSTAFTRTHAENEMRARGCGPTEFGCLRVWPGLTIRAKRSCKRGGGGRRVLKAGMISRYLVTNTVTV
jgi:hypothetical protein